MYVFLAFFSFSFFAFAEADIDQMLEVAIIGGGQSGMSLWLGLQSRDLQHCAIFDKAPPDLEGPWRSEARMLVLRSKKSSLNELGQDMPDLTFQAWYEDNYGAWDLLEKVPTAKWAEYLNWYKKVRKIPLHNEWELRTISWEKDHFRLFFNKGEIFARKVVLATGRSGCGGLYFPEWANQLPRSVFYHTGETIDPSLFSGKKVCVIGGASSAFDVAAVALESGASSVDMLMRKTEVPQINHFAAFTEWDSYYFMDDEKKVAFFQHGKESGIPPPLEAIKRLSCLDNYTLWKATVVTKAQYQDRIVLETNHGNIEADLVLFATGYQANANLIPELEVCKSEILTWNDKMKNLSPEIAHFAYLGRHFEFLEKNPGSAPYLKHIYCFNYGAFMSHGRIAGDIDQLKIGLMRLIEGLSEDASAL